MKKRTTLFLCIFFSVFYLLWLFGFNYFFMPESGYLVHTKFIEEDIIMTGNDDRRNFSRSRELLPGEKVNINTCDELGLQELSGIGPELSSAIIRYREEYGPFESIEDIKNVRGIGESRYQAICEYITVGGDT